MGGKFYFYDNKSQNYEEKVLTRKGKCPNFKGMSCKIMRKTFYENKIIHLLFEFYRRKVMFYFKIKLQRHEIKIVFLQTKSGCPLEFS